MAATLPSTPAPSTPQHPAVKELTPLDFTKFYTMYYRHGMNPNLTKSFFHDGDLRSAISRAKDHCDIMGYRLQFVKPLVADLKEEELSRMTDVQRGGM